MFLSSPVPNKSGCATSSTLQLLYLFIIPALVTCQPASPEENMNYISTGLIALKYIFFTVNAILCIVAAGWTILNRNEWIVKVSQPNMLMFIILGCFISNLGLLFEGIQTDYRYHELQNPFFIAGAEPIKIENPDIQKVDAACMAANWLFLMGFALTIAALLAKIQRVKLIHQATLAKNNNTKKTNKKAIKDHTIGVKNVAQAVAHIVAFVLTVNLILLTLWQVLSPYKWVRHVVIRPQEEGDESAAPIIESFGFCYNDYAGDAFVIAILSFDALLLLYALVLCWQTRDFDDNFAESHHISLAILFIFQVLMLGLPIVQLLGNDDYNSNIFFFVIIGFDFITNFIVLTLLFIPKMWKLYNIKNGNDDGKKTKTTIPLYALTHSRWDQGVDIINGLLDGESDTYHTMNEEQREGLKNVRSLLLNGVHHQEKSNRLQYIPQALMEHGMIGENKRLSLRRSASAFTYSTNVRVDKSVHFLMREYGGIHLDSFELNDDAATTDVSSLDIESNFCKPLNDNNIKSSTTEFDEAAECNIFYIPKEFRDLPQEKKLGVYQLLSWSVLKNWDYNVFDLAELSSGHPLLLMGYALLGSPHSLHAMGKDCGFLGSNTSVDDLDGYHFADDANLCIPMRKLCNYLRIIEEDYTSDNPYHNEIHGADVLQTLHALIQMKGDIFPTTKEELFSILLSAVVHDVNHPGENNAFQMHSISNLALVYNDISVLENRHASHAFAKMLTGGTNNDDDQKNKPYIGNIKNSENNILCNVSNGTLFSIRKRVVDAVLHTDMSKHFQSVDALRALVLSGGVETEDGPWKILQYMLHLADISNPAKPKNLALLWTDRCLEEFFAQGDKESRLGLAISPNCDRKTTKKPDSQIGFINFVIKPAYEVLAQIIPSVNDQILVPHIETNLEYWKREKEIEAQKEKGSKKQVGREQRGGAMEKIHKQKQKGKLR